MCKCTNSLMEIVLPTPSGVSREGAPGARALPLALTKYSILYSWNSDNRAPPPLPAALNHML